MAGSRWSGENTTGQSAPVKNRQKKGEHIWHPPIFNGITAQRAAIAFGNTGSGSRKVRSWVGMQGEALLSVCAFQSPGRSRVVR